MTLLIKQTRKEIAKIFGCQKKKMIGKTNSTEIRYLKGHNNEEIYEDEGKK